jgi:hypothetical protein
MYPQILSIITDAITIFYAILIEALPFIVLGVLISSFLSIFVKDKTILKLIPKNRFLGHITIAFFGMLFPVCECGNLPVARRLIAKGIKPSQAITFLLAAPVINPIVIISTYVAFSGIAKEIVILRVVASYLIAVVVGLVFSLYKNQGGLLKDKFIDYCSTESEIAVVGRIKDKVIRLTRLITNETINVFSALLLGSLIAAIIGSFSRTSVAAFAHSPLTAIIVMMVLAFIMTICSTVDAFVALGYVGIFPLSSILAFLVFGPMIDLRSLSIMSTTFKTKTLVMLVAMVTELVVIFSVGYSLFGR